MKRTIASLLLAGISFTSTASEGHWTYQGTQGTAHWGEQFSLCANGVNQSPINISTDQTIEAELPTLTINYHPSNAKSTNNGHTIQANILENNTFSNDAGSFDLLQFHFHAPSENTFNGKHFPLEAHFVHANKKNQLAVLGVMFKAGKENKELNKIWKNMPETKQSKAQLIKALSLSDLLPNNKDYYRFNGSLTTPPCTEGVRWFVLKEPLEVSTEQIEKFRKVMGSDTNRPTQAINARTILK